MNGKTFRIGIVGYGGSFSMGRLHMESISRNHGFEVAAVCDPDTTRQIAAKHDFSDLVTFGNIDDMLARAHLDLAIIVTPHNTHAELALRCINAGVGVVVEKPMAISTDQAQTMLDAAARKKVMLSTFHNRRWDGDYLTLKQLLLEENVIGRVFRVDCGMWSFGKQKDWWRASRAISGGYIFDWGPHYADWILGIIPGPVRDVTGQLTKNPAWNEYDNEDHSECLIRFENGCLATFTLSNMAAINRPKWFILGERGSLTHEELGDGKSQWLIKVEQNGRVFTSIVPCQPNNWDAFYQNIAAHLQRGQPLAVTPQSAARVIAVLDSFYESVRQGSRPVTPAFR